MKTTIFAAALAAMATSFAYLRETKQNSAWDDLRTKESEKEKSDLLVREMRKVSGWAPGAPYCAAFDGAMVNLTLDKLGYREAGEVFLKNWTAHCMTNVRRLKEMHLLSAQPADGALMLMPEHGLKRWSLRFWNRNCDFLGVTSIDQKMMLCACSS